MHSYQVLDVFTDTPLQGNQLAVFDDGDGLSYELMQRTARELNLSETVFMLPPSEDGADVRIRIFTPTVELPFAGHPTLGSAYVIGERTGSPLVHVQTEAGVIPVALTRAGNRIVLGEMEQQIPTPELFPHSDGLLAALGIERSELPIEYYRNGPALVYVALGSEDEVAALRPDITAIGDLGEWGINCFAVAGTRVKTRMFGPSLGVAEDPATGSAAGPLALHLARHGWISWGEEIEITQGVEIARPSLLRARVDGSAEQIERILVGGAAVVVAHGEYRLG